MSSCLLDKENDKATEKDRIYITRQEKIEWAEVEKILAQLRECLDQHGDVKSVLKQILPAYHEAG